MRLQDPQKLSKLLSLWFQKNQRDLPWRKVASPYSIWISEVMLQQTTVVAVIPYFEKFMQKFPQLEDLAKAPQEEVLEAWAGLGYYSRARNLHASAQKMKETGFPKTHTELRELPGFGPYTSRAVASLAFGERVGVLDGNVIRVLCRLTGFDKAWWNSQTQKELQAMTDELTKWNSPSDVNQGLMELGRTVCTPQRPTCLLCPLQKECQALREQKTSLIPLPKPRRNSENWLWNAQVIVSKKRVAVLQNDYAPFLKKQWIFPGETKKVKAKPKNFNCEHSITHHQIFVQVNAARGPLPKGCEWVLIDKLKSKNPSSLLQKVLQQVPTRLLLLFIICAFSYLAPLLSQAESSDIASKVPIAGPLEATDLSDDGDHLLFLARNRANHIEPQVYELNIPELKERRISFSDGKVFSAVWNGNKEIIYSSSTDKLKEISPFISRKDFNFAELYQSDLEGLHIERLTRGEAKFPRLVRNGPQITVFRNKEGDSNWQIIKSGTLTNLTLPKNVTSAPRFVFKNGILDSEDHLLVWKNANAKVFNLDFKPAQILSVTQLKEGALILTTRLMESPSLGVPANKIKTIYKIIKLDLNLEGKAPSAKGQELYTSTEPLGRAFASMLNHRLIFEQGTPESQGIFYKIFSVTDETFPVVAEPIN